jgi:hypothetical protein
MSATALSEQVIKNCQEGYSFKKNVKLSKIVRRITPSK